MPAIRISPFLALLPRTASRLLPDTAATVANNVNITSGEIRPIRQPAYTTTLATGAISAYRATYDSSEQWMSWTVDVNMTRGSFSYDVEPRFYWTGDNEPRFAPFSGLPSTYYSLGIPTPIGQIAGSVTGGAAASVTRYYRTTFYSTLAEESSVALVSAAISGPEDGSWDLTSVPTKPPKNSGSCTVVYGAPNTTVTTTGSPAEHWCRVGDEITLDGTATVVTSVTSTTVFVVAGNFTGATAWARVAPWNITGLKQRLYRTTGTTGSWQLVDDDIGFTGTYSDTLTDAQILGDALISDGWISPPTGLRGIITLPNGSLCGFVGQQLCFSEPYQPHAWPLEFQYGVDFPIVGIEAFGTSVVVATQANPYIADGIDPGAMSLNKAGPVWPCLSKRSVCTLGTGVVYASAVGLIYVGDTGADVWTKSFYTEAEWEVLNPDTMQCAVSDSRLFVLYTDDELQQALLSFNLMESALTTVNPTSSTITNLYTDMRNGELYFILSDSKIYQHNAAEGATLPFVWESKDYISPYATTLTAGRISYESTLTEADIAAVAVSNAAIEIANAALISGWTGYGALNGAAYVAPGMVYNKYQVNGTPLGAQLADINAVSLTLYVDDVLRFSGAVPSNQTFRMPSGYKGKKVRVQLTGVSRIHWLELAGSPSELAKQ